MAAVMVASVDTRPRVTYADSAALRTLGLPEDHVVGREPCELLAANGSKAALEDAIQRGYACRLLMPRPASNGSAIERRVTVEPLTLNGATRHTLLRLEDTATATAPVAGQPAIMDLISHELRSPLNSALTWVSLLEIDRSPKTIDRALAVVRQSIREQARLIDDLVEVGRSGRHPAPLDTEAVDFHVLIEEAVEAARGTMPDRKKLESSVEEGGSFVVEGDRGRVARAVAHLLDNALKFMPSGGTAVARLNACDGFAVLEVSDEGVGLAPDEVAQTFTPFWRAQPKARGGGLGLGVVRSIALRHGGAVCARSAGREHGSTFTLTLPLRDRATTNPRTG